MYVDRRALITWSHGGKTEDGSDNLRNGDTVRAALNARAVTTKKEDVGRLPV